MKAILPIFAVAFLLSCSSPSSEDFNLKNMQSKNPKISAKFHKQYDELKGYY